MRAKILSASAGSGKTYSLAYKFIHDTIKYFHSKPYLYRAILAVTFTNKATEQMKSRILKELGNLSRNPESSSYMADLRRDLALQQEEIVRRAGLIQQRILHDYSRFTILTIDKFFQRILRAFLKELGYDLNYSIELDQKKVLQQSVDSLIEDSAENEELLRWIEGFVQESVDDNNSWDIRETIKRWESSIFNENSQQVIENAVPKEKLLEVIRSLQERFAVLAAQQKAVGKRALQMMDAAGVEPDDFAYKTSSRGFISLFTKSAAGEDFDLTASMKKYSHSTDGWSKVPAAQSLATELFPLYMELCELCRHKSKVSTSLKALRKTYRTYAMLRDIYGKMRDQNNEEGVMLLSETKHILSRFIADNDTPFIYEKMGNRFERFMIDEFQDTSLKEWHNFVPLLRNAMAQSEDESVLIVGDVKQSIYRWRGGDWRILKEYVKRDLGNAAEVPMNNNWRSLKQIVEFNNDAIRKVVSLKNADLNKLLEKAIEQKRLSEKCYAELRDMLLSAYGELEQTPRKRSDKRGYVRVELYDQDEPPIVDYIESAIARGYSYNDILILCRTGKDGARIAKVLMEYKRHNNTFNLMTRDSLIVGGGAVSSFIIAVMRLSLDPDDAINRAVVNDYLGRAYDAPADENDLALLSAISQLSPEQAFERIVIEYGLGDRKDEVAYLQALHEQVVAFCSSKSADIQLFLKMWDEKGYKTSLNVEQNKDTIELTTIHKAKGLERKVVIIPYCKWPLGLDGKSIVWAQPNENAGAVSELGCFPVQCSKEMMAESEFSDEYYREVVFNAVEGINILYVALTRAEEELYVCMPYTTQKEGNLSIPGVGKFLWEAVQDRAQTDGEGDSKRIWAEFGAQEAPDRRAGKAEQIENVLLDSYPTSPLTQSPRTLSHRYLEEDGEQIRSARSMGVLMHGVLSESADEVDVMRRIDLEQKNGHLSDEQASELKRIIKREFCRDEVREWFGEWDEVRTENDILSAGIVGTRRPDRVMIRGERAVVVDYKFGEEQRAAHHRQVATYAQLLREMGYTQIEGYVWYLSLGHIVKVDCNTLAL